jgi:hypothetical protein
MEGIGLPVSRHWQYTAVFQYVAEGDTEPDPDEPPPTEGEWIIKRQTENRIVLVRKQ